MTGQDMKQKLEFYFKLQKKIHIACDGGIFYNGLIIDLNSNKDFIIFTDAKLGDVPIMFEEINRIEPFREVG